MSSSRSFKMSLALGDNDWSIDLPVGLAAVVLPSLQVTSLAT